MTALRHRTTDKVHGGHVGVPERFKPPRDKCINSKIVPCPQCKAEIGEPCVTEAGTIYGGGNGHYHKPRRRMAIRKLNEQANTVVLPTEEKQ